jgi:Tfp pilus assembly protein FimT
MRRKANPIIPLRRGGFTLLEMLLVVAVLMATIGICWPLMQRAYNDLKVRDSAESVRLRLAATRLHAIDAGLTYQFRYEANGRRYVAVPFEPPQSTGGSTDALAREMGELPDGLTFESEGRDSQVESLDESLLAGLPDASRLADAGWGPPIMFYSDGSASDTKFRIFDENRQFIEISLRELTGFVTVSPVHKETKR